MAISLLGSPNKVYNRPSPRHREESRRKPVTIGIGIKCTDGIVLSADTLITVPGYHKYYQPKISTIDFPPSPAHALFTFAGDPELMKTFKDKFIDAIHRSDFVLSVLAVKDTTEDILQEMEQTILNSLDRGTGGLQMLCASCVEGCRSLLRTKESSVHEVDFYDYVGAGDSSLIRYLTDLFLTQPVSIEIGSLIASYFVSKAKEFVDGCGGDTDLAQLMTDGKTHVYSGGFRGSRLIITEFHLKQFMRAILTPGKSEKDRNQVFENLSTSLRNLLNP